MGTEYQPKSLFSKPSPKPDIQVSSNKSIFSKPTAKTEIVKPVGPQMVFGSGAKIRKRIQIEKEELFKYSTDEITLRAALNLILTTNLDELKLEYVLAWGSDIQKEHKKVLENLLGLYQSKDIQKCKELFGEIIAFLEKLNPVEFLKEKIWDKFLSTKEGKEKIFQDNFAGLQSKISMLESNIPNLVNLQKISHELDEQIKNLQGQINPYIISCSFFAEYNKDDFPTGLFISRLSSLLSTQSTLISNKEQRKIFDRSIVDLIDGMQNILLTEIPSWYSNYISVLSQGLQKDNLAVANLAQQQDNIINKLKNIV